MNNDPVRNYLNSFKNKMPIGYKFSVNTNINNNTGGKIYTMRIKTLDDKFAAGHAFIISNKEINLSQGHTSPNHQRKGFGGFLRAVATKAGKIAKKRHGRHNGVYMNNESRRLRIPASTRILPPGWKRSKNNNTSMISTFNYTTTPINEVNRTINKYTNRWHNSK
jgi:hypothetical protein